MKRVIVNTNKVRITEHTRMIARVLTSAFTHLLPYAAVEVCLHGAITKQVYVDGKTIVTSGQQFETGKFQQLQIDI